MGRRLGVDKGSSNNGALRTESCCCFKSIAENIGHFAPSFRLTLASYGMVFLVKKSICRILCLSGRLKYPERSVPTLTRCISLSLHVIYPGSNHVRYSAKVDGLPERTPT